VWEGGKVHFGGQTAAKFMCFFFFFLFFLQTSYSSNSLITKHFLMGK